MKRRDFIALVGGAAGWPLVARGQSPPKVHRIAIIHPSALPRDMSETGENPGYRFLFQELRRLSYVEGRNLVVERYSAEGRGERFPELAREVVRTKPDLIFATSNPLVLSFKAVTDTIPVGPAGTSRA